MISIHPTKSDNYLDVTQVIALLRENFNVVAPDPQQGLSAVAALIYKNNPSATQAELDLLLEPLAEASLILVADDPRSDTLFLRSFVVPNQPIWFDWVYPGHMQNCVDMVHRYADAIGYTVEATGREA